MFRLCSLLASWQQIGATATIVETWREKERENATRFHSLYCNLDVCGACAAGGTRFRAETRILDSQDLVIRTFLLLYSIPQRESSRAEEQISYMFPCNASSFPQHESA